MGEFLERQAGITSNALTRLDIGRMKREEARMVREADLVLVTSERERKQLIHHVSPSSLAVVRNGVDAGAIAPLPIPETRELLFVGAFSHYPNVDAVLYFAHDVFPALHSRFPDTTLRIVGKSPTPEVLALNTQAGVDVVGEVESVEPYYRSCRACIVPLRAGGGTRLKILEALAFGRPVVSTQLGCEGLDLEDERHLLMADEPHTLQKAIARVLTDRDLASRLAREGRRCVEKAYDWNSIAADLLQRYQRLVSEPGSAH